MSRRRWSPREIQQQSQRPCRSSGRDTFRGTVSATSIWILPLEYSRWTARTSSCRTAAPWVASSVHIAFYAFCVDTQRMHLTRCLAALFPETRRTLLATMLSSENRWWYLSELAETIGTSPSSLQRELHSLVEVEVLSKRVAGRKVYFRTNAASPIYKGLCQLFLGTKDSTVPVQLFGSHRRSNEEHTN